MGLYTKWCDAIKAEENRKKYWRYVEKADGREVIRAALAETVRSHYDRLERIADDVARLGFKAAAEILRSELPQTPRAMSGDLGEILATELVEEEVGLRVPVRRLRYKDGRNMAMRGDDFIGAGYRAAGDELWLLKGEAKSSNVLRKSTEDYPDRLLGRALRDEVGLRALRPDRIDHMLFTLSGNEPHPSLKDDLDAAGLDRDQYVVNLHIEDHQHFISEIYEEVEDLGND